jgi:hypothetical protein
MSMDKEPPTEKEISDLLRQVQPRPGAEFQQRMAAQLWNRKEPTSFWANFTPLKTAASLGLILLLVVGISLFSPSLDTLAQRFYQFFSPAPSSRPSAEIAPLQTSHPLERFTLTIPAAEALAGFVMKTPDPIPEEFHFLGATYDELRKAIILHYATASDSLVMRISQQHLDSDYQGISPEAEVESVEIGPYAGEYVSGGWIIPEVELGADATPTPIGAPLVWDPHAKLQILRWTDGEFLYEIILAGGAERPGYLDKNGLIALANQMK